MQKGTGDPFCVRFVLDSSGLHYFTVVSSAPQYTEHNDAWFRFSASVVGFRPASGSKMDIGRRWFKGFQNLGRNEKAGYILTGDHNGHQVFVQAMKGVEYKACISGRSSKYTIFNMVFVRCDSFEECNRKGQKVSMVMGDLPPAQTCT